MQNLFTINIQVSLSPETLEVARKLVPAGDLPDHCCEGFEERVTDIVLEVLEQLSKHAAKPERNSGKTEEPAPEAPAEPAPAPAPEKTSGTEEVTDAQLREAVKGAKDRSGGTAVRTLFSEFGIPNSSACPVERRSELLARLAKL